jgi:hypothetical protein
VTRLRSASERKAAILAALQRNVSLWLATASLSGKPHVIAVSTWWDGKSVVIATRSASPTGRNLEGNGLARLIIGSPDDVVIVDVEAADSVPVKEASADIVSGFKAAAGWDAANQPGNWSFYRLRPVRAEAYLGYHELEGREVMRDSRWLD